MGKDSKIAWTDHTWNPWVGCKKVSEGCTHCYMYRQMERFGKDPTVVKRTSHGVFYSPHNWKDKAKVFTCSWSDFFIKEADEWRGDAWKVIQETPHLTYLILTKRPELIKERLPKFPLDNVWLGVTVESDRHKSRFSVMYRAVMDTSLVSRLFVSYEPSVGPLDLYGYTGAVRWLISGGESFGRDSNPEWFRNIMNQCKQHKIPFFHKQNGGSTKIDGAYGGDKIDGIQYHQFPEGM